MNTLKDRAKLRASQQRRLEHAVNTIEHLIAIHMPGRVGEHETAELRMMELRLLQLIKNQHVINREVAAKRISAEIGEY